MRLRFYLDPRTRLPHIFGHDVTEDEVEEVLAEPSEDRAAAAGSRVAIAGDLRPGPRARQRFRDYGIYSSRQRPLRIQTQAAQETLAMTQAKFPTGWDENRVQRVLAHYETQTDAEAVAEDEAAYGRPDQAIMGVPTALVPAVRELIAKHQK